MVTMVFKFEQILHILMVATILPSFGADSSAAQKQKPKGKIAKLRREYGEISK